MIETEVTVVLRHDPGDEYWSASVPLIEGCVSDGKTPEEAAENIREVIGDFLQDDPSLIPVLTTPPTFMITNVKISLPGSEEKFNA